MLATFSWQSEKWMGIARQLKAIELSSSQIVPALAQADIITEAIKKEGKIAYAYQQTAIRNGMLKHCNYDGRSTRLCYSRWKGLMPR